MSSQRFSSRHSSDGRVPRRTFVKGLAVGGAGAGLGLWRTSALAQGIPPRHGRRSQERNSICGLARRR